MDDFFDLSELPKAASPKKDDTDDVFDVSGLSKVTPSQGGNGGAAALIGNNEAWRKAQEAEALRKAQEMEAWRKAQEAAQRKEVEDVRRTLNEEALRKQREDITRKAHEEAIRKAQAEAIRKAQEKAARKAQEDAVRKAQEEAVRKAQEEMVRKAQKEASRKAQEEAIRKAQEDQEKEETPSNSPNTGSLLTGLVPSPKKAESKVPEGEAAAFSLVEFALLTEEVLRKRKASESPSPQRIHSGQTSALSLVEFALILWKGKFIIAACTVLAIALGALKIYNSPIIYSSSSFFVLNTSGATASMSPFGSGMGGKVDPSDYLDKVLTDGQFLSTLYERKWFYGGDMLPLEEILKIQPDTTAANVEHSYTMKKYNRIRGGRFISTHKDHKTGVIALTTRAPTPQLAYDLNTHTLDYIGSYIRNSIQGRAKEKRVFVEGRMQEAKRELDRAEYALANFSERNMMTTSPIVAREASRLARQIDVYQEMYVQLLKQLDIAKAEELDDMALVQTVKYPEISYRITSPQKVKILAGAIAAGLFIGCVLSLVIHQFRQLKHVEDIKV